MTRIVDSAVLACPCCTSPMRQARYASIHVYGATHWSDGFTSTISIARSSDLGVCPSCEGVFWVDDAKKLGIMHRKPESTSWSWLRRKLSRFNRQATALLEKEKAWRAMPDEWNFTGKIRPPNASELVWAVANGIGNSPTRERRLRQKLWWLGNHSDRGVRLENPMNEEQRRENQLALLELVRQEAESQQRYLTEAELLRQLGCFDKALAILEHNVLSGNETAVLLAEKAQARDTRIVQVASWSVLEGG